MAESKHTKGPWSVVDNSWEVSSVYGPEGNLVAQCRIDSDVTEDTQDELEAVKEANSLLIAAAPDLLEALRSVSALMDFEDTGHPEFDGLGAMISAAIAKAEATS